MRGWRLRNHSTQPKVFKLVDKDRSGAIDFNQFASLIGTASSICLDNFTPALACFHSYTFHNWKHFAVWVNDHQRKLQSEMSSFIQPLLCSFQKLREAQLETLLTPTCPVFNHFHIFYVFVLLFSILMYATLWPDYWLSGIRSREGQISSHSSECSLSRLQKQCGSRSFVCQAFSDPATCQSQP